MSSAVTRARARVASLVDALAARLLGGPLTGGTRSFLANFGYLLSSDVIATLITFGLSTYVVRLLGPEEFGSANLVIGTAQLFVVPMLLGLHAAAAREIASSPAPGRVLSSTLVLIGCLLPAVVLVGTVTATPLSTALGVPRTVLLWSLGFAAVTTLQIVTQAMLTGLRLFARVGRHNVVAAVAYAVPTAALLVTRVTWTYALYVLLSAMRLLVFAGLCLKDTAPSMEWPQRALVQRLARFGAVYSVGSVAYLFALSSIDTLMLNAYHGVSAVGLYGAYYAAFNIVASRVTKLVSDVLLPTASAHGNPSAMYGRVARTFVVVGWLAVPAAALLCRLLFVVYGGKFEFSWVTASLLGLCIYMHLGVTMSADLLVAKGLRGVSTTSAISLVTAVANLGGNALLIPAYSVDGSLLATAAASLAGLMLRVAVLRRQPVVTRVT